MSHPNDDAKFLLRHGLASAMESAKESLLAADSGDDDMSKHARLVLTYLQGYANGKGFSSVMTPDQFVKMELRDNPFYTVLLRASDRRKRALSDDEYAFYNDAIEILEGA